MRTVLTRLAICCVFSFYGCAQSAAGGQLIPDEIPPDNCVEDEQMIVAGEGRDIGPVEAQLCYVNDSEVIFLRTEGKTYRYESPIHIGAKVRFEYLFRKTADLFLVTYGYDSQSIDYDYILFEVGNDDPIDIGQSPERPRIEYLAR
ncbi:hypothetical protein [Hyphococcus luteus]|uniref:DUF4377 domain-containing protein n=1 Tax=Hyphococcus luteus TaxID=2058213 RepID=A0A2S7KAW0_9PROT|nr:hypothetical protein [Marinicaulis flavus]PQA89598.1 hypothetical protein CW354_01655 [Marinicaulis flavus]